MQFYSMKTKWMFVSSLTGAALLVGCQSIPPGAERGPNGTMAYDVLVEASQPGAHIEVKGQQVGDAPVHIKIYGDPDGTFHDFGSFYYVVRALPVATNQYPQAAMFRTGHMFSPEDRIPPRISFDMNQPQPSYPPPAYYPEYGPPPVYYYGPPVYYGPPYYGPTFRFDFGPGGHRRW